MYVHCIHITFLTPEVLVGVNKYRNSVADRKNNKDLVHQHQDTVIIFYMNHYFIIPSVWE